MATKQSLQRFRTDKCECEGYGEIERGKEENNYWGDEIRIKGYLNFNLFWFIYNRNELRSM